jgi:hypothetical protein
MIDVGFRDLHDNVVDLRNKQTARHPFFMSGSVLVPNRVGGIPGMAKLTLVADQDADILITGINGSVIAPADSAGRRSAASASLFPFGISNVGVPIPGFAGAGLEVSAYAGTNQALQLIPIPDRRVVNDLALGVVEVTNSVPVGNFLQPGYFLGRFVRPYPWRYYLRRSDKLVFQFHNRDTTAGNLFHFVSIVLTCKKYSVNTR